MGIGTSLGGFFEDDHHYNSVLWDPEKYDVDKGMVITPRGAQTNKALDDAELHPSSGMGIEVGMKEADSKFLKEFDYRNKPYDSNYDTKLGYYDEQKYNQLYGPNDSQDYDMRGYFKDNPLVKPNEPGVHYPDTYKKPNHPTFSMDSKYNGVDEQYGGVWGEDNGADTFKPSSTNLKNLGKEGLQDYFNRVEPKAKLLLDKPEIEDRRDDQKLDTYQEILDGQSRGSTYAAEDNKLLDRPYTALEKDAGMKDLDKTELDLLVKRIQRGMAVKEEPIRPPTK